MSTRSSNASSAAQRPEPVTARAEIQPAGFLIALGQDWRVRHVSENIGDHFADFSGRMAGQPLADFFGSAAVHSLRNQLALMRAPNGAARLFSLFFAGVPKPFDVALHVTDATIILEALPATHVEAGDPIGTVRELAGGLGRHDKLQALLDDGAHQLRALTGFDRVVLFRLDGGAMKQVAEDSRGNPSPAATPPSSAAMRMISDAEAPSVAIEPPVDPAPLERAILRSPTAAERDSIRANGAAASLSLPLRLGNGISGMVLCLNQSPRRPMLDRLAAAELFADLLAMRIEICELKSRR